METVVGAFHDADVLLVVTDLFSTPIPDDALFGKLRASAKPVLVAVNKIDLAENINTSFIENLGKTVKAEQAVMRWRLLLPNAMAILPCTAAHGPNDVGVNAIRRFLTGGPDVAATIRNLGRPIPGMFSDMKKHLISDSEAKALLPMGPPLYGVDALTDRTDRFVASELIRSALFELLKKEIPYCCEVRVDSFREPRGGDKKRVIRISASVVVERDSQKKIVVGKDGEKIKAVGVAARAKLEEFLSNQVRSKTSTTYEYYEYIS